MAGLGIRHFTKKDGEEYTLYPVATVWEVTKTAEKYTDVRVTISDKQKDGSYAQSWNGFLRLIGNAHEQAISIGDRTKIRIKEFEVHNNYDKVKKITYTNVVVFDIDVLDDNGSVKNTSDDGFMNIPDMDSDEMPFK